jgi:hypothetical protein
VKHGAYVSEPGDAIIGSVIRHTGGSKMETVLKVVAPIIAVIGIWVGLRNWLQNRPWAKKILEDMNSYGDALTMLHGQLLDLQSLVGGRTENSEAGIAVQNKVNEINRSARDRGLSLLSQCHLLPQNGSALKETITRLHFQEMLGDIRQANMHFAAFSSEMEKLCSLRKEVANELSSVRQWVLSLRT